MKKVYYKIFFISVLLLVTIFVSCIIISHRVKTDLDFCKELAKELEWLDTEQYQCTLIDIGDNEQTIRIHFKLRNLDNYSNANDYAEAVYDIGKIKMVISEYLNKHSDNLLNNKKIICMFNNRPDDIGYMYNYDYRENDSFQKSNGLYYFKHISVNISTADNFKDARIIKLIIKNQDELKFLKNWDNLEYVELYGIDFSNKDKQYIIETLPNCTIICNGETISESLQ